MIDLESLKRTQLSLEWLRNVYGNVLLYAIIVLVYNRSVSRLVNIFCIP